MLVNLCAQPRKVKTEPFLLETGYGPQRPQWQPSTRSDGLPEQGRVCSQPWASRISHLRTVPVSALVSALLPTLRFTFFVIPE